MPDGLLSPDFMCYFSPTTAPLTSETQKQRLVGFRAAFPDMHVTIEEMITQGDRVAMPVTLRGIHRVRFQGIAPTDKEVAISAFEIVHIENEGRGFAPAAAN